MAGASSDEITVGFWTEATYAENPPAGPPKLQLLPITGESLGQDTTLTRAAIIRNDRMDPRVVRTDVGASGDLNFAFMYSAFDALLEYVLQSDATWDAAVTNTATSIDTFNSVNALSQFTGTGIDTGIAVDDWIRAKNFSTAVDGRYKVTAVASGVLTVSPAPPTPDVSNDVDAEIKTGSMVKNGKTQQSIGVEFQYTDLSSVFRQVIGLVPSAFALNVNADTGLVDGSFSFLGQKSLPTATSTLGDGSPTAAVDNPVFNTNTNVTEVHEGGAVYAATSFSTTIQNNLRQRKVLGTLGAESIGAGKFRPSGTVEAFFDTRTVIDKYLNDTQSSIAIGLLDDDGNSYIIDYPAIKYSSGRIVAGGENQDIIAAMDFEAFRHSTQGYVCKIARWPV